LGGGQGRLIASHADFVGGGQGQADLDSVGRLAQDQADGRVLVAHLDLFVQGCTVELGLAHVFRLELADLQLGGHEALQAAVEKEQVDVERVGSDGQRVFFTDEREVAAEFEEEVAEVGEDGATKFSLGVLLVEAEEFEHVVIFERK